MARERLRAVLGQLRRFVGAQGAGGLPDAQLLERFLTHRDEAAFDVLLWRHGPIVLGVCRRVLRHDQDAEDAFQATFLAFVRKGRSIGKRASVGGWLYKVAYRTALAARSAAARRGAHEKQGLDVPATAPPDGLVWRDLRPVLDAEVNRLPEKYRVPFVLCHLEGMTTEEAARHLGWPRGTVGTRVAWARERLRARLTRRGLTLSAGGLALVLAQGARAGAVPAPLAGSAVKAALLFAANPAAGVIPAGVAALTEGVLRAMWWTKGKLAVAVVLALGVVGTGVGVSMRPALRAGGQTAAPKEDPTKQGQTPFVYALLRVARDEPRVPGDRMRGPGPGGGDFDTFRKNQMTLVKSRLVLVAALRNEKVRGLGVVKRQADPVAWLEKSLGVDFPNDGDILRIGMSGDDPEQLVTLVNAVQDTYLKEVVHAARNQKLLRLDELEKICSQLEEKIRKLREKLTRLAENVKTIDPERLIQRQKVALEAYSQGQQQADAIQLELRRAEAVLAVRQARAKKVADTKVPDWMIEQALDEQPGVRDQLLEIGKLKRQENAKRAAAQPKDRGRADTPQQLKAAYETLEQLRTEWRPVVTRRLRQKMGTDCDLLLVEAKEHVNVLRGQLKAAEAKVERLAQEADRIGIHSIELQLLRGEIQEAENTLRALRAEKERLQVELSSKVERIRKLQPAATPPK
jgi:RNA polymerase sigma factor (sigma-70 family)